MVGQSVDRHSLAGLVLGGGVSEQLLAGVLLVAHRSIQGVNQDDGERPGGRGVLRPIAIDIRRQGSWLLGLFWFWWSEECDLLLVAGLFYGEVFGLEIGNGGAAVVGGDHVNQYHSRVHSDSGGYILRRRGLLGQGKDRTENCRNNQ